MKELLKQILEAVKESNELAKTQIKRQNCATLDANEAAEYLGISYFTLLEMVNDKNSDNRIPHFRIGGKSGRLRFRIEALDLWMQNNETVAIKGKQPVEYGKLRKISE